MRAVRLRRIETILFVAGFVCLTVFLGAEVERMWFQWRYSAIDPVPVAIGAAVPRAGPVGIVEIPRVGVSAVVFDGVDRQTLRRGVGHLPGTAYPGESGGRVALAAHRDTFFRGLRFIKVGDLVRLYGPLKTVFYRVESIEVVKPWRTDVLLPAEEDVLTLVTCFPFTYVGSAPERFVAHARRIDRGPPPPGPGL